ncbi:hypothetical protein ACK2M7_11645 [Chryseobacterium sp. TY4]
MLHAQWTKVTPSDDEMKRSSHLNNTSFYKVGLYLVKTNINGESSTCKFEKN